MDLTAMPDDDLKKYYMCLRAEIMSRVLKQTSVLLNSISSYCDVFPIWYYVMFELNWYLNILKSTSGY